MRLFIIILSMSLVGLFSPAGYADKKGVEESKSIDESDRFVDNMLSMVSGYSNKNNNAIEEKDKAFYEYLENTNMLDFYIYEGSGENEEMKLRIRYPYSSYDKKIETLRNSFEKLLFKYSTLAHIPIEKAQLVVASNENRRWITYNIRLTSVKLDIDENFFGSLLHGMTVSQSEIKGWRLFDNYIQNVPNVMALPMNKYVLLDEIKVQDIEKILRKYFKGKGEFIVIKNDPNYFQFLVNNARGEIVKNENYWEKIQGIFTISAQLSTVSIRLILDGQYASGLGKPKTYSYYDMEPKYSGLLQQYGDRLLSNIKKSLELRK